MTSYHKLRLETLVSVSIPSLTIPLRTHSDIKQKVVLELLYVSVTNRVLVQNLSNEDECDLHKNKSVGETHFHMNGFAPILGFDTEAQGNSEMAYFFSGVSTLLTVSIALAAVNSCRFVMSCLSSCFHLDRSR